MREYHPGKPLVFSHIPKTAGTSVSEALRAVLQPDVVVRGYDRSLYGAFEDFGSLHPKVRASIFLEPSDLPADAGLVFGHIAPATTRERYPGADHITILRNPQVRVLSQWLHGLALTPFDLRRWGTMRPTLELSWLPLVDYLDQGALAPNTDNTITRFLVWPHDLVPDGDFIDESADQTLLSAALSSLDSFEFTSVTEDGGFLAALSEWLGRELRDTRLNQRTYVPARLRPELGAELTSPCRELLRYRTRLDTLVWKHVAARVLDADLDRILDSGFSDAIRRYERALLNARPPSGRARRLAQRAYGLRRHLSESSHGEDDRRPQAW